MTVVVDNWNYEFSLKEIEKNSFVNYEKQLGNLNEHIGRLLKNDFKTNRYVETDILKYDNGNDLLALTEKNKQLRQDIDTKLEELGCLQNKYEGFKQGQNKISQDIKERHEAFLMAKKFYKKYLKIYYTIESKTNDKRTIFIQFFSEARKDSENYSLRLLQDTKCGQYELINTTPKLTMINDLQKKLQETNDVPEILCCVRQAFIALKSEKSSKV